MASVASSYHHLPRIKTSTSRSASPLTKSLLFLSPPPRPAAARFRSTRASLSSDELAAGGGGGNPDDAPVADPVKLAFSRAEAYRKSKKEPVAPPSSDAGADGAAGDAAESPEAAPSAAVELAMQRAKEYTEKKGRKDSSPDSGGANPSDGSPVLDLDVKKGKEIDGKVDSATEELPAAVRLAMERAAEYKENKTKGAAQNGDEQLSVGSTVLNLNVKKDKDINESADSAAEELPVAVRLAMERAKEYKENKTKGAAQNGIEQVSVGSTGKKYIDSRAPTDGISEKESKKEGPRVSSIDFLGFGFSEKKRYRGTPPGLSPPVEPLMGGDLPEVEIIIGDRSKFGEATSTKDEKDDSAVLYKPKVSTWGVFPRPSDISKTYGGGRVIKPGEVLETAEDKASKEQRSKELISAYKSKMGLTIDPKVKAECEKALKEGDRLMELGKLREALPYYEKVMIDLIFQSELHGLAALQWSICQDSLRRSNEARVMYEKLQSHPNVQVSKRARQFVFSFQAMEMMKVTSSSSPRRTGYETYFDAFVENKDNYTSTEEEEGESILSQGLPYFMLLLSPILIVLLLAIRK